MMYKLEFIFRKLQIVLKSRAQAVNSTCGANKRKKFDTWVKVAKDSIRRQEILI